MNINKKIIISCLAVFLTSLTLLSFQKDTIDSLVYTIIEGFASRNILSNTSFFVCDAHTEDEITKCIFTFDLVCKELSELLEKQQ